MWFAYYPAREVSASERRHAVTPELFDDPLMPKPIECEVCGQMSVVHNVQYVYQRTGPGHDAQHDLKKVVAIIECVKCGVRTQTIDTSDSAPSG